MPILAQQAISNNYVKVKWKEPYVSDALNKKFFGIFPKGIYSGFSIGPGGLSGRDVLVGTDYVSGFSAGSGLSGGYVSGAFDESLGMSVAVHQNSAGESTTVQIPPPNNTFHLDATGLDGQRVYVALNVSYIFQQITTAQLILCDSTLLDQDPSLIVLGHVDVPVNPLTPLDESMFGYDDPQYPRLTPLSNPLRAGLMPKEAWGLIGEIHQLFDLGIVVARDPISTTVDVTPATGQLVDGTKVRLPIGSQVVEYDGGTINFATGTITGGGDNFTSATSLLSASQEVYYSVQILKGSPNTLLVLPGTPAAIGSAAYAPFADGAVPRAQVLIRKNGGGVLQPVPQSDVTLILASGSGSGAGTGGSDLIRAVWENEKQQYSVPQPNQFLDNFSDDSKGTYVNCGVEDGQLKPSGVNTSYSYERTKETTSLCTSADGVSFMSILALAPTNTAIASNTIEFQGDVTPYIAVSKPVTILREFENDGVVDHVHLTQQNPTIVARLLPTSVNFSSGVTTVVLDNPKNLDITMGVSPSNQNSELRICPADYQFQASVGGTYQDMSLVDAHIINAIAIPGQSSGYSVLPGAPSGSVEWCDMQASENKQYVVVAAMFKTAANTDWHFWYSKQGGADGTFVKFAAVISTGTTTQDEMGANWQYAHRNQIKVANNGKAVVGFFKENPAVNPSFYAAYSDLGDSSPTLSDFPTIPADAINDYASEPGVVFALSGGGVSGATEIDKDDGSLIVFAGGQSANLYLRFYTWTGASPTHFGLSTTGTAFIGSISQPFPLISGTAPNRRITVLFQRSPDGHLDSHYFDEGNLTEQGSNVLTSTDGRMIDVKRQGNIAYICIFNNFSPVGNISYIRGDLSTQVYSSQHNFHTVSNVDPVTFSQGYGASYSDIGTGLMRLYNQRMVISPNDSNRICIAIETLRAGTNYRTAKLYEVTDTTNFLGQIYAVAQNSALNFRDLSTTQQYAQIITGSAGNHINSFMCLLRRNGTFPSNATIHVEIQGVSAGAPDGVVLATSDQVFDASKISTAGAGVHYYFTFPQVNLTNAVQYAIVLKTTNLPISGSNYIVLGTNNSAPYVGGNLLSFNGTSWSDTGHDISGEINGFFVQKISDTYDEFSSQFNTAETDQDTSINLIDSSSAQILFRRARAENTSGPRAETSGFTYRSILTFGSGTVASTFTPPAIAGYASGDVDPNLVVSTSYGIAATEGKSVTTGLGDGQKGQDRSGNSVSFAASVNTSDYVADSDFDSGFCMIVSGVSSGWSYEQSGSGLTYIDNRKFIIETEWKPNNVLGTTNYLVSKHLSGNNNGFLLYCATDGTLQFATPGGPGPTTVSNETFSAGVRYRLVVTGDGSTIRMFYKAGPGPGALTEVTYFSQNTSYNVVGNGYGVVIGTVGGGSSEPFQRFGLFKFAIGADSFLYDGFKDQSSIGAMKNVGTRFLAERRIGHFGDTIGGVASNFNELVLVDPSSNPSALVNSYEQLWKWNTTFTTGGSSLKAKLLGNRVSSSDPGGIPAVGWEFFSG